MDDITWRVNKVNRWLASIGANFRGVVVGTDNLGFLIWEFNPV